MAINWVSAIVARLIATAVMTLLMYIGRAMGMRMDMPRLLGLMFFSTENTGAVYTAGFVAHFMMGAIFGILYAIAFWILGIPVNWVWGAFFGLIHGIALGFMLPIMPKIHPRMGRDETLPPLGKFGSNYGSVVPAAFLVLHIVFGAVIGWIYQAPLT